MRKLFVLAIAGMALSACAEQNMANQCFVGAVKDAVVNQDFNHWNLPNFVDGNHMRGGQYVNYKCEIVGQEGSR